MEGQVRGIARMIEREEYCVDILQQTAALRAAVDSLSIIVLEDHVAGCVRTAAEQGKADAVRRRGHRRRPADARPAGPQLRPIRLTAQDIRGPVIHESRRAAADSWITPLTRRGAGPLPSGIRTGADARVTRSARGPGRPGRNRTDRGRPRPSPRCETMPTPGAAPRGRMAREPQEACRGPTARAAPDARRGHPDPPRRVRPTPSTPGWHALGADADAGRPAPRSTVTSACCWPGPRRST